MRQAVTRRWWEQERHKYDLFVSEAVENERRRGCGAHSGCHDLSDRLLGNLEYSPYRECTNPQDYGRDTGRQCLSATDHLHPRRAFRGGRLGGMTRCCRRSTPCATRTPRSMATTASGFTKI